MKWLMDRLFILSIHVQLWLRDVNGALLQRVTIYRRWCRRPPQQSTSGTKSTEFPPQLPVGQSNGSVIWLQQWITDPAKPQRTRAARWSPGAER
jgi:hypothetical protein